MHDEMRATVPRKEDIGFAAILLIAVRVDKLLSGMSGGIRNGYKHSNSFWKMNVVIDLGCKFIPGKCR